MYVCIPCVIQLTCTQNVCRSIRYRPQFQKGRLEVSRGAVDPVISKPNTEEDLILFCMGFGNRPRKLLKYKVYIVVLRGIFKGIETALVL